MAIWPYKKNRDEQAVTIKALFATVLQEYAFWDQAEPLLSIF